MSQPIRACSVCWGSGLTMDNKPCFCGCRTRIVSSKPEDYGLPSYQQLQERIANLTRQRDLAVEALKSCGVNDGLNGPTQYFDEELVELAIKESEQP